ncbi:tRNA (adenosine(37)-N6)-threonylcarbamoyltransferase complex ATPase subunit type 1 TsaE [Aequorivita sp. H23M31]|uniref:tRNA threonylcarbamoyladenosine biosynthesis protein TsaE n=1 Tax=Aequorivita ciconiae TaxID=2494375 RepID=A0A410G0Y0_9FLAO|nr:tRNA (adenosine(37)-N6)-threonylcarbamoyltransferase complex ATPase subunit type 1 TsaE [Aequorivita sp. H23M31]QAA80932.1 tRNA (adenosine(37)-N6)-threonylcarbamoyltransferase complex ATPase subunit type 1 TsaE [Aequorivita sp. H23M31]
MKMTYTQKDLPEMAEKILKNVKSKVILFKGSMGVGKTTLIKELANHLGSQDTASSPTFAIVNEYEIPDDLIYHFDFYRIKDIQEALDLGVEDYLYSGHFVFIEWPEKIESLLPEDAVELYIRMGMDGTRTLTIDI